MIIDTFLVGFEHEREMIDFRIKMLEPYVDAFVMVECDRTFAGKDKGFHFKSAQEFPSANGKLQKFNLCIPLAPEWTEPPAGYDPEHPCWQIERAQRDAINDACKDFPADSFVLIGDVDEIPSHETMELLAKQKFRGIATLKQFFFYYNLDCMRHEMWDGTIWCPIKALREFGAQALRDERGNTGFNVDRAGWHLSYFGGVPAIQKKIASYSHQENNTQYFTDSSRITDCITKSIDLFDRGTTASQPPKDFFPLYFRELAPKDWAGTTIDISKLSG